MTYPENSSDFEKLEITDAELAIEADIVSLADSLKTAELAQDKFKSFKFEQGIITTAKLPSSLAELLALDAQLDGLELAFRREDGSSHTELAISFAVQPRTGTSYFLHTTLSDSDLIESYKLPLETSIDTGPEADLQIPPLMSEAEMMHFIASIAQHETLDHMSEFTRQSLANPAQFKHYLTNPFAYQHLDSWFAPDTLEVEITKNFQLFDPLTNNPIDFSLTFVNNELINTRAEFWSDRNMTESHAVSYVNIEPKPEEPFDRITENFYDDTFYDFGAGTSLAKMPSSSFSDKLSFAHNGTTENIPLADKQEIAGRLRALLDLERIRETNHTTEPTAPDDDLL